MAQHAEKKLLIAERTIHGTQNMCGLCEMELSSPTYMASRQIGLKFAFRQNWVVLH